MNVDGISLEYIQILTDVTLKIDHIEDVEIRESLKSYIKCLLNGSSLPSALCVLRRELDKDKSPGSYYYVWQSNIACAIMDVTNVTHELANKAAMKFLDQLIG